MAAAHYLDLIDYKIVRALSADARLSYAEGLSPSVVAERIHRLENDKVIIGYHVQLDEKAFGYSVRAFIRLTCDNGPLTGHFSNSSLPSTPCGSATTSPAEEHS
jgi:DNA-binding Lrp family transcriptional regulator